MQLPETLQEAIEEWIAHTPLKQVQRARESVSAFYREGADSHAVFQDPMRLASYLLTRLPATYGVARNVFSELRARVPGLVVSRLLDLGAGPGSAAWAAVDVFSELRALTLIERERPAIEIGRRLAARGPSVLLHAEWRCESLNSAGELPEADVAVLSYVFGEMGEAEKVSCLDRMEKSPIRGIVVIEPGTPEGYRRILQVRDWGLAKGFLLAAPCPHSLQCPMSSENWCHFAARIERSRLHRLAKDGVLGYEDEKFSYMILLRGEIPVVPCRARVVGRPHKGSGHVQLPLCKSDGGYEIRSIGKSRKEEYRAARGADWGSALV
jgi:ribosomal protein RSM22 (predicted rRNA methylase)